MRTEHLPSESGHKAAFGRPQTLNSNHILSERRNALRLLRPTPMAGHHPIPLLASPPRLRQITRMLTIDDLSVRVAGRLLIDGASALIPDGARVGLVGRNGAGKTTLFRADRRRDRARERQRSACRRARASAGWRRRRRAGPRRLIDVVLAADSERAALLARGRDRARSAPHRRDPDPARRHRRACGAGARRRDPRRPRLRRMPTQQRACSEFSGGWRMRVALAAVAVRRARPAAARRADQLSRPRRHAVARRPSSRAIRAP